MARGRGRADDRNNDDGEDEQMTRAMAVRRAPNREPVNNKPAAAPKRGATKGPITVYFDLDKATPGTYRYNEVTEDGEPVPKGELAIGTLYVQKSTLGNPAPKSITVTLEIDD